MYDAFGWERPQYMHLPPIMRDATHKLSKRHGDANFEDFLAKGYLVSAIVNYIALLGWAPSDNREKMTMAELMEAFDVKGISKSGSILDEAKMKWPSSTILAMIFCKFSSLKSSVSSNSGMLFSRISSAICLSILFFLFS